MGSTPACSTVSTSERRAASFRVAIPSSSSPDGSKEPDLPTQCASCTRNNKKLKQPTRHICPTKLNKTKQNKTKIETKKEKRKEKKNRKNQVNFEKLLLKMMFVSER